MLPVKDGAYIVAKFVDDVNDLKDGRTYIVLTKNDGLVYKRVSKHFTGQGLLLCSDNKAYQAYHVPMEQVLELWEFTCCINTQEYDEKELKLSSIMAMFRELQVELEAVKRMS
jgi:hypothetical protein